MSESGVPIDPKSLEHRVEIPDFVVNIFNDAIKSNYVHGSARIPMRDVNSKVTIECYMRKVPYDSGFMNVEPLYRERGWTVKYVIDKYGSEYYVFTAEPSGAKRRSAPSN